MKSRREQVGFAIFRNEPDEASTWDVESAKNLTWWNLCENAFFVS
jgi:hypothetical protein